MYASGVWIAKEGHEDEFVRAWQTAADQTSLEFAGVTFRLLRDVDDPRRFVAFSGAWKSAEDIAAARAKPAFQEAMARATEIVESVELSTLELVGEVS